MVRTSSHSAAFKGCANSASDQEDAVATVSKPRLQRHRMLITSGPLPPFFRQVGLVVVSRGKHNPSGTAEHCSFHRESFRSNTCIMVARRIPRVRLQQTHLRAQCCLFFRRIRKSSVLGFLKPTDPLPTTRVLVLVLHTLTPPGVLESDGESTWMMEHCGVRSTTWSSSEEITLARVHAAPVLPRWTSTIPALAR